MPDKSHLKSSFEEGVRKFYGEKYNDMDNGGELSPGFLDMMDQ